MPPWCGIEDHERALALTTDCTPRYCAADPEAGRHAGGGRGLAQPHRRRRAAARRHRQHEFRQSREARDHGPVRRRHRAAWRRPAARSTSRSCAAMSASTTRPRAAGILPTPAIGGARRARGCGAGGRASRCRPGCDLVLIGETAGLARPVALAARDRAAARTGAPPPVDLAAERRNGDFVRGADPGRRASRACHDVSDGGLLVAVAEMAMAGDVGVDAAAGAATASPPHAFWFGEDQARYVLAVARSAPRCSRAAEAAGVPARRSDVAGGHGFDTAGRRHHIAGDGCARRMSASSRPGWTEP